MIKQATKRVTVANDYCLHARPAAFLVQAAQKFNAEIRLSCGDRDADGKSILSILMLCPQSGSLLEVSARGHDADEAVVEVEAVLRSVVGLVNFGSTSYLEPVEGGTGAVA